MKKTVIILLCLVLVSSFASCGKKAETAPVNSEPENIVSEPASETVTEQISQQTATEDNYTLGTLVTVNGDTEFVLKGLRLDGNRSAGENNGKDFATEGIRSGFWLDERISFYLDTDYSDADSEDVKVICLPHRAFTEYEKTSFEDITENAAFVETFYGMEEPDYACFDPYVFSEDFTEGDYDILFTFKGEIAYYVVINLTSETI